MSATQTAEVGRTSRLPVLPLLVLAYAAIAFATWPAVYIRMARDYAMQAATLAPPLLLVGVCGIALIRRRGSPFGFIAELIRARGPAFLTVSVLGVLGISGFTTLKLSISRFVPFWADPMLAGLDHALHFGDPGILLHHIIPDWLGYGVGVLYGPIWAMCWFGFVGAMALHPDPALRQRYYTAMVMTMALLGTIAATAFSSVGPVFYDYFYGGSRFAELWQLLEQSAVGEYMALATKILLVAHQSDDPGLGTGISAMPSMHLAVTTLHVLLVFRLSRIAGYVGCVLLAIILAGSAYLGWHYLVDGYFSIIAVIAIWWAAGRITRWNRSRAGLDRPEDKWQPFSSSETGQNRDL